MTNFVPSAQLLPRVLAGDIAAIARLISRAEADTPEVRTVLCDIYRRAGRAHVIGITGVPGSGKSTLVGKLTSCLRRHGRRVAVVAIDPSSPYSGGAILGDRVRMTELTLDPGVYIRSMASRGATGGMARAALEAVDILDVAGFDTVIIETVGVGQDEVEIAKASHTTIVVSAPGLGDEIQALKAGLLEVADVHAVSKCDRSDANRTVTDLKQMLALGVRAADAWIAPVVATSAYSGDGIDALASAIDAHRRALAPSEALAARRERIAGFRLLKTAENLLLEELRGWTARHAAGLSASLAARETDPYTGAQQLIDRLTESRGTSP
jgi:GTPase